MGFSPVSILEPMILGGRGAACSEESSRLFDLDLVPPLLFASLLVPYLPKGVPREGGSANGVITDPRDWEGAR